MSRYLRSFFVPLALLAAVSLPGTVRADWALSFSCASLSIAIERSPLGQVEREEKELLERISAQTLETLAQSSEPEAGKLYHALVACRNEAGGVSTVVPIWSSRDPESERVNIYHQGFAKILEQATPETLAASRMPAIQHQARQQHNQVVRFMSRHGGKACRDILLLLR